MTEGFRLDAVDEGLHAPDPVPNFNESVYVNGFDAASGVGGWIRLGNRVNEGYAELSVCLYLPGGEIACQFRRPGIAANDRFDAGGLSYEVLEPFRRTRMRYRGEMLVLKDPDLLRRPSRLEAEAERREADILFDQEGVSPMHGGEPTSPDVEPMYGREFSRGHFNQHMRTTGHVRIGERSWTMDGHGWRDHSWGPRYWQANLYHRLFTVDFGDGHGFMLVKVASRDGRRVRRRGVLMVDHAYEEVTDLDFTTRWTAAQDPAGVDLVVRTARRTVAIVGEVVSLAPLRNRRQIDGELLVTRIAEGATRYRWGERSALGMIEYIEQIEDGRLLGHPG